MRDRIEFFFFQLFYYFLRLFPFSMMEKFGKWFGSFSFSVLRIRRSLVLDNLTKAFPEKSSQEIKKIAKGSFQFLFAAYLEILCLDTLSPDEIKKRVKFPDAGKIHELLEAKKGLIILSGHFGNWELNALATPLFAPEKYTIIVQTQRNKYVNAFMYSMRTRFNTKSVVMEMALRDSLRALQNNEAVALLSDQSGPESGIYVNFFGRPASTHQGAAVFQVRTGAKMVQLMLIREGNARYRIELEEIDTSNIQGTTEEKVREITARHVAALERYVRTYPEQWLWMHKRWKHSDHYQQQNIS